MIFDAHTDVLWKMLNYPDTNFYEHSDNLAVNYPNLKAGKVDIQIFAIFVSTYKTAKFKLAIQSIDDFYEKIIMDSKKMQVVTSLSQLERVKKNENKLAILSLEGAEALEGELHNLRILYKLGVRAMGLTWNNANEIADGILEVRNAGLTRFGVDIIKEMNLLGMAIDLSHISEQGFWDVVEISQSPICASHSNSKKICNHPRNLTDEQLKAIINMNGIIGITFIKDFVSANEEPSIYDLLRHIDHIADLGGINNIGLGSDFDGGSVIKELSDPSKLNNLTELLYKRYKADEVEGILGNNWLNYYRKILK